MGQRVMCADPLFLLRHACVVCAGSGRKPARHMRSNWLRISPGIAPDGVSPAWRNPPPASRPSRVDIANIESPHKDSMIWSAALRLFQLINLDSAV